MFKYTVTNWYWFVGSNRVRAWSSAQVDYVPASDPTFRAWLAAGNSPTVIPSAEDLAGLLSAQWVPIAISPGVNLTSTATPSLNGTYSLTPSAQVNITAISTGIAAGKPLPGGGSTFLYADANGLPHAFSATDFLNFATEAEAYVYQFGLSLQSLVVGTAPVGMPSRDITIA